MRFPSYTPATAWRSLPVSAWDREAVRHLLRRAGFSASTEEVRRFRSMGPQRAVRELLSAELDTPALAAIADEVRLTRFDFRTKINATDDREERQQLQRELRQHQQRAFQQFAVEWMALANDPAFGTRERLVVFLQNIFVVGRDKVYDTQHLINHQQILRSGTQMTLPELCKAVSRSSAMILYLDLNRSSRQHPNENFARELMELFTLGEGNYTENDVREAARAFTGYRIDDDGNFVFQQGAFDPRRKELFGKKSVRNGDDVIDAIFEQPASERFFIKEFLRSYLGEDLPPEEYITALGDRWRYYGFSIPRLVETVFRSRLFYDQRYRGALVKSPTHFYLGLCQELRLHPTPFPRQLLNQLRSMGQDFQNPPNVRGWLGGNAWISASTVSARRALVESLFQPINEERLNADDQIALDAAREAGRFPIRVAGEQIEAVAKHESGTLADHLIRYFLPRHPGTEFRSTLADILGSTENRAEARRLRAAIIALLQTPHYQLC